MPNIIYVLSNEAMPGLVKIGYTTGELSVRVRDLSTASGVPLPFEVYFAAEVPDPLRLEKLLHALFSEHRINPKREFFQVDPERVVLAISIGPYTEVTPGTLVVAQDEQGALNKAKARRSRIALEVLGILPGAVLTFSRDEALTAQVLSGNRVDFEGENLSLSAAALRVLHRLGYTTPVASGSDYWMYEGELLDERRKRLSLEANVGVSLEG